MHNSKQPRLFVVAEKAVKVPEGVTKSESAILIPNEVISHKPRPGPTAEDEAGLFSKITFGFMSPMIKLGARRPLQLGDVDGPPTRVQCQTVMATFDKLWVAQQKKKDPKLWMVLLDLVKRDVMIVMLYGVVYSATLFTVPFLFPRVLEVIAGARPQWEGYLYAGIIYGMNVVGGVIQSHSLARMTGVALKVRGALSCVIYQKALRLGTDAWKETTTGQVFNMVGQRVEQLFRSVPILQSASYIPLLVVIAFAYLFYVLGWAATGGLVVLCLAVPFNYHITKSFRKFLFGKYGFADKRMTIMNQVLQAIRVIKFYAWENSFVQGIEEQRCEEVAHAKGCWMPSSGRQG